MAMVIECTCGTVLREADTDSVVAAAQTHAREVHDMDMTTEQARDMVRAE